MGLNFVAGPHAGNAPRDLTAQTLAERFQQLMQSIYPYRLHLPSNLP